MNSIEEDAVLGSDLDAQLYYLRNLGGIDPVPANLAQSDDPRLSDERPPAPGSVTNASVAADADIEQSKLNLNGDIPGAWLGTAANQAAQGDLVEYRANRDQPFGYPSLDGSGKVLVDQLPGAVGTGTVTSVGLVMPGQFSVTGTPITGAGVFSVDWAIIAPFAWFGNKAGAPGPPQFYTDELPTDLIPDLSAGKVQTGIFDAARIPEAVGVGPSHSGGGVPDPGDGSGGAVNSDYLARDMTYKAKPTIAVPYQPTIPDPTLGVSTEPTGPVTIKPSDTIAGVTFFYSFTSGSTGFVEFPDSGYVSLPAGDTIWVYAAHAGYNNSNVVNHTNTNAP